MIADPPITPAFAEAIWTGEEMLIFGGVGGGGVSNLVGAAAYNPETDSWRRLADLPYGLERTADSALGDGVVYAWPSPLGGSAPGPLSYDLAKEEWMPLPDLPASAPSIPSLTWTGEVLFAYGAASDPGTDVVGIGVTFDPVTQTWSSVEPAPLEAVSHSEGTDGSQAAAWTGSEVYIWTGWVGSDWEEPFTRLIAYDPSREVWRELDPAPIPSQGLWHQPISWTGSQLITYTTPMLIYAP